MYVTATLLCILLCVLLTVLVAFGSFCFIKFIHSYYVLSACHVTQVRVAGLRSRCSDARWTTNARTWQSSFRQAHTSTSASHTTCAGSRSPRSCSLVSLCSHAHANVNVTKLTTSRKQKKTNRSYLDDYEFVILADVRWNNGRGPMTRRFFRAKRFSADVYEMNLCNGPAFTETKWNASSWD